jgi:hypothetical protein
MAALTTIALGVAAAGSTAQAVSGAARASKAKKALENFQRQELRNVTEGMRVSTLGAQLQTQEAQRRFATGVEALRSGGVRGLVGGLGVMEQQQQDLQQQISADLDRQQAEIEQARAQDEANIRQMQEQRESSQIAGLGAELAAGRQQLNAGITGLGQTALSAATLGLGGAAGAASGLSDAAKATQVLSGIAPQAASILQQGSSQLPFGRAAGSGVSPFTITPLIPRQ